MKTALLYLKNTYQFEAEARFLELRTNDKGTAVILDQTIFYPQGGGQPSDTGYIQSASATFRVDFVGLDPEGVVWHFGEFEQGNFDSGQLVRLAIDSEKRKLHARIHSAGHLVDCALQLIRPDLTMDKGFHFTEGSYVEGDGEVDNIEALKAKLEQKVNEIIQSGARAEIQDLTEEEAREWGLVAPAGKSVRVVGFGDFPACGCGGTHVEDSRDIGSITIRKIVSKKGRVKISYDTLTH